MIKVNFKELKLNTNDLSKKIKEATYNAVASKFSVIVEKGVKDLKCKTHQNSTKGTIDVITDLNKTIVINKHSFCCDKMKNSIDIPVKY